MFKNIFSIFVLIILPLFSHQSQTEKLLALKKAELALKMAKGDYERALKLKESGLISEEEFSKKRNSIFKGTG